MTRIQLYGPAQDRLGRYRDAGAVLIVGPEADVSEDVATRLVESGGAVRVDPLDHDANGRKGGAAKPAR
ncbi:MAG: hypothetical protein QHC65_16320 [Sphingomonas sp.]|nr:hypothetical protein [Sphingomonas sp.]MDX3885990.1 hypothetical protein [Sphingomonas sp.]